MRYGLRITGAALARILEILERQPARRLVCPAGVSGLSDRVDLLVGDDGNKLMHQGARSVVFARLHPPRQSDWVQSLRSAQTSGGPASAVISLGIGPSAGLVAGTCFLAEQAAPLDSLCIVAPGLPNITLRPMSEAPDQTTFLRGLRSTDSAQRPIAIQPDGPWSRTIGALGQENWRRLISLRLAVVGCGRTGSLVAASLARLRVRELTLIDADNLEAHNISEMDVVTPEDDGEAKVLAVAARLSKLWAGSETRDARIQPSVSFPTINPVPESTFSLSALVACKQSDVLICCVDNPGARLAAGIIAKLYLKPMLDIGTGIFYPRVPNPDPPMDSVRQMGADVRFILPERCLLCVGGISGVHEPVVRPSTQLTRSSQSEPLNWQEQRAGSLRSLNQVAAGLAVRVLEDFMSGGVSGSVWLRLEYDNAGLPTLERHESQPQRDCWLCRLAATGDAGLSLIPPDPRLS